MRLLPGPLGRLLAALAAGTIYSFTVNAEVFHESLVVTNAVYYAVPLFWVWWVQADSRQTGYWPAFHYAWWLYLAGPILVPHYVLKTRGRAGLRLALGLVVAMLAPSVAGYLGWWLYPHIPDYLWIGAH